MSNFTEEARRAFAEKIISGEYNTVVVLLENSNEDNTFECWRDGKILSVLGLLEAARIDFTKVLYEGPDDEG